MFRSKSTKTTTVVAREAHFEGSLELGASAHIEGSFQGTLKAEGELSVGPDGAVQGTLTADSMVVAGRVQGTIVVRKTLQILQSGSVSGHVYYESLEIARGGMIAGEVHQGEPNTSAALGEAATDEQSGVGPAAARNEAPEPALRAAGQR